MNKYKRERLEKKAQDNKLDKIDLLTLLQLSLFDNGLDVVVSLGSEVTLEVQDMQTESTVAVIKGKTLENAYANLLGRMSSAVRDMKTMKYEGLSRL